MNKILIIEDDPAIQLGVKEYLSSNGYEILLSSDGKEGYDLGIKENPDLILLDINLPSVNGLEVCRILREKNFRNPIIMLTSMSDQIDKIVGLEVGADDYITKPFNFRELLARIRAQLKYASNIYRNDEIKATEEKNSETIRRHLLVVMFSDMVEYSKKMNENEDLALTQLKVHDRIIENAVIEFSGKVIEKTGDGFLSTFESAANALDSCKIIQQQFKEYNSGKSENEAVKIRIGLHIGDVLEVESKVKGDAINVAKRIQESAEPESIFVSENFYLTVKRKTETKFKSLGAFDLKNIKDPFNLYKVLS